MNRYINFLLSVFVFFLCAPSLFAQPSFFISDATVPSGSNAKVMLSTTDFTAVVRLTLPITWNPTELEFVGVSMLDQIPDLALTMESFDTTQLANGRLTLTFEDTGAMGVTIFDNGGFMDLFELEFKALIPEGESALITIPNSKDEIMLFTFTSDIVNTWNEQTPENLKAGTISTTPGNPDVNFTLTPQEEKDIFCIGDRICYDVKVKGFENVLGIDATLDWEDGILRYVEDSEGDFAVNGLNVNPNSPSSLKILWLPNDSVFLAGGGQLDDNTTLFSFCLEVTGENNSETELGFLSTSTIILEPPNLGLIESPISNDKLNIEATDCDLSLIHI